MSIFNFNKEILQLETDWDNFVEIMCIALDLSVSFRVYWYKDKPDDVCICNLFVVPDKRLNGIATSIINTLKEYCFKNNKSLNLWCDDNLVSWYVKLGFVLTENKTEDGSKWMSASNIE